MPNEVKPLAERITRPSEGLEDDRGWIRNLVLNDWRDSSLGAIGGVELIHSRSGALRANHKHTRDWHYLYVVYGKVNYEEFGDRDEGQIIEKGEMVYTPPGVWHRLWSMDESLMICISHLPRDKATHETDVVRVDFGGPEPGPEPKQPDRATRFVRLNLPDGCEESRIWPAVSGWNGRIGHIVQENADQCGVDVPGHFGLIWIKKVNCVDVGPCEWEERDGLYDWIPRRV